MSITPRLKKEIGVLVGGTLIAYAVAALCGISKTAFASSSSTFGVIVLILACRSLVAAIVSRGSDEKRRA